MELALSDAEGSELYELWEENQVEFGEWLAASRKVLDELRALPFQVD